MGPGNGSRSAGRKLPGITSMSRDDREVNLNPGGFESFDELARRIEQQIESRVCGRIHNLRVDCSGGRIVLRGRCRTYHAKQLAQEAALELAAGMPGIVNQISVG